MSDERSTGTRAAARQLFAALLVAAAGLISARLIHVDVEDLAASGAYTVLATALLAVGLFGSTFGISREVARFDVRTIVLAVTAGVLLKAVLIAGVMYLVFRDPAHLVLAIAVTQIDPLSVAARIGGSRMSPRARTILLAWASFDDPITVVLTVYLSAFALWLSTGGTADLGLGPYLATLGWNLALAAAALVTWAVLTALRRGPAFQVAVLLAVLSVGVAFNLMLAVALTGLFFRPAIAPHVERATKVALHAATFMLGMLLVSLTGAGALAGVVLGAAAFGAQAVAGLLVAGRGLRGDRVSFALAQQNGITAVILALSLQPAFPQAVAVIAPAILTVNVLHIATNSLYERRLSRSAALSAREREDVSPAPPRRVESGPQPSRQ
ncbi:hypothetical protein [Sinosporangium siamense]|uniref:Uncharacterized protein n=1 Tax=Sinosporangium siamense TaxID=1367973 RepID=A0A919RHN4_9ACTN|nr:hypothetical protein [Sinosporangium siamense]GII92019.1 hypothetical protein Ssi02_22500 [Sinosporangium siamense]